MSPGDVLAVSGGEVLPVDGVVLDAQAVLDESALTGESRFVERQLDEAVRSGTVNAGSALPTPFAHIRLPSHQSPQGGGPLCAWGRRCSLSGLRVDWKRTAR